MLLLKNSPSPVKLLSKCQMLNTCCYNKLYHQYNKTTHHTLCNTIFKQVPNTKKQLYCTSTSSGSENIQKENNTVQELPLVSALDIRVGLVTSVKRHPDADTLYIETIEVGEEEPRTILSGLVPYLTPEELDQKRVIVLCNLKARNMRGIKSHGMILCASNKAEPDNSVVDPLVAPDESEIGERIFFDGDDPENLKVAETENRIQKKKIWEKLQPKLRTNSEGIAQFEGKLMKTKNGYIKSLKLKNAQIS